MVRETPESANLGDQRSIQRRISRCKTCITMRNPRNRDLGGDGNELLSLIMYVYTVYKYTSRHESRGRSKGNKCVGWSASLWIGLLLLGGIQFDFNGKKTKGKILLCLQIIRRYPRIGRRRWERGRGKRERGFVAELVNDTWRFRWMCSYEKGISSRVAGWSKCLKLICWVMIWSTSWW